MSEVKSSPAPWNWDPHPEYKDCGAIVDATGKEVCDFGNSEQYYPSCGNSPNAADLALMLAAPGLRDACEKSLSVFVRSAADVHSVTREEVQDAENAVRFALADIDMREYALTPVVQLPMASTPKAVDCVTEAIAEAQTSDVPMPRCEWRGCSKHSVETRCDAAKSAWLLCAGHAMDFDARGFATVRIAKR